MLEGAVRAPGRPHRGVARSRDEGTLGGHRAPTPSRPPAPRARLRRRPPRRSTARSAASSIVGTPAADRVLAGPRRRPRPGRVRRHRPRRLRRRHRHRERRCGRPRRRELRDRLAAPLGRPVRERRQPARDRGRAGQLRRRDRRSSPRSRSAGARTAPPSNIGTAVSTDAGRTWQRSFLPGTTANATPPGPETAASDPSVAFDAVHGVWLVSTLTIERVVLARLRLALDRRQELVGAGRRGRRRAARQGVDRLRQRRGEPVPGPLLSRVHGRPEEPDRQPVLDRRRGDVVDAGARGLDPRRHAAGRAARRHARRRRGRLPRRGGALRARWSRCARPTAARRSRASSSPTCRRPTTTRCARSRCRRSTSTRTGRSTRCGTTAASARRARATTWCSRPRRTGSTWSAPTRIPLAPASSTASFFIPGLAADPAHPGPARARVRLLPRRLVPARSRACSAWASRSRATPARRGRCSGSTRSPSRRAGSRAPKAAGWSATTSRSRSPATASCRSSRSRRRR